VDQTPKLGLGESHRRIVSALLRGLEDMCAEIERWIDPAPGVLVSVEDRLGPAERDRLRALVTRLLDELRRLRREIELDVSERSAARSIQAQLVEQLSLLEETAGGELRGYGELEDEPRRRLEQEFRRLHRVLEDMLLLVRRKPPLA
jgi:hypothetical protein